MQILVNTDYNLPGHELFAADVSGKIENAFQRFRDRINRVEVHVSDHTAAQRGNNDKRCMIEVRLEGRAQIAITDHSSAVEQSIDAALKTISRTIGKTLDRLREREKSRSDPFGVPVPDDE